MINSSQINRFLPFVCVVLAMVFLWVSRPSGLYFLCDDWAHIPESSDGNFFQTHLLRPLIYVSLWLDTRFWGMDAFGFHLTNLVLHLVATGLVYLLARKLLSRFAFSFSNKELVPVFSALFFLCYAYHSEPVFWIVGRGGSLSTVFVLASLLLFLKKGFGYFLLSLLCFALALFTYELSWVLPLLVSVFWLYECVVLKKAISIGKPAVYWLIFSAFFCYRFGYLSYELSYGAPESSASNLLIYARNFASLMARLFIPPLHNSYVFLFLFALVFALLIFMTYLLWRKNRQSFYPVFLMATCSGLAVLPALTFGIDTHDTESERFIYLASVFACIFLVLVLAALIRQKQTFSLVLVTIVSLHLLGLYHSSKAYRYASDVSQKLVQTLNGFPHVRKVNFINLPTQYEGALLFRIGFVVNKPGILRTKYDSINVTSYRELKNPVPLVVIDRYQNSKKDSLTVEFTANTMLFY